MIRLNGGRMMPCSRSIGITIDGAMPSALIAMICSWLIEPSASLPVFIDWWMRGQPVGRVVEVGAELDHHGTDGVAAVAGGRLRPLGVQADRDHRDQRESGSASCSIR